MCVLCADLPGNVFGASGACENLTTDAFLPRMGLPRTDLPRKDLPRKDLPRIDFYHTIFITDRFLPYYFYLGFFFTTEFYDLTKGSVKNYMLITMKIGLLIYEACLWYFFGLGS